MIRGSFDDFLNELRAFESGVSEARIAGARDQVIQQVGQDRFDAFEAGELTLTDLQYSSTNFLGFVGYQFGEAILIDLEYYDFDATPGINDFSGAFTGKNGVNSLDDLKTNVQEQIILDEFALNLSRIETGLGNSGQSLDDFIGQEFTFTDVDGSQVQVELSLTGILAAAHLRGAFGTLNLLQNGSASADEIGTSILQFAEQFGGFEAPSVTALINGEVPPLVTDSTLRPGGVVIDAPDDGGAEQPDQPGDQADAPDDAPDPGDAPAPDAGDFDVDVPAAPAAVQQTVVNGQGGLTVTGTDGDDPVAFGNTGDDIIAGFDGDDAIVGFNGDDFLDGGDGDDRVFGSQDDDTVLGGAGDDIVRGDNEAAGNGADVIIGGPGNDLLKGDGNNLIGADVFVFVPGDGDDVIQDFQVNADRLDFSAFGDAEIIVSQQGGDTLVSVGDVTVTLQGVNPDDLNDDNFNGAEIAAGDDVDVDDEVGEEEEEEEVVVEDDDDGGEVDPGVVANDFGVDAPAAPAAVQQSVANGQGGLTVTGTDGADPVAFGNTGDDIIAGFGGDDALVGFNGNDFLDGGDGNDRVFGSQDDDTVLGGAGDDIVRGDNEAAGNGADIIVGGPGNDLLKGDGNNLVGADVFVFAPGDGDDIIQDFQTGADRLDFSAFGDAEIGVSQQGSDTLVSVGDVTVILQGVNADDLNADNFNGADIAAGDDAGVEDDVEVEEEEEVIVEDDNDGGDVDADAGDGLSLVGGRAVDDVQRRAVDGTDGDDVLNQSNFVDAVDINGRAGDDVITGTSVAGVSDVLRGGDGNDTFFGLAGDDFIVPGAGDDLRVVGGAGSDTFFPQTDGGNDIFPEFSLQDRLDGTLLDGLTAINASRLENGRTLLEFEGANTTVQISGGVSPEQFAANANELLVNFPDGVVVQVAGADVAEVIDNGDVEVEEEEDVVVDNNDAGNGDAGVGAGDFDVDVPAAPAAVQQTVVNGQGGLTVTGTDGDDPVAFGNTGDDIVAGFGGDDAIVGFNGNDFLDGGDGNDRVFGSQDDDIVLGGAGDDIVRGDNEAAGNGNDIIVGGPGNDLLKGDGNNLVGADEFLFAPGDGDDIIQDFQFNVDTLDFTAFGAGTSASVTEVGNNTVIGVGDVTVTLEGVEASSLNANNVLGVTLPAVTDDGDQTDAIASVFSDDGFLA